MKHVHPINRELKYGLLVRQHSLQESFFYSPIPVRKVCLRVYTVGSSSFVESTPVTRIGINRDTHLLKSRNERHVSSTSRPLTIIDYHAGVIGSTRQQSLTKIEE